MLKNLLVNIPSERLIRPVIEGAISLAVSHGAHLHAISVGYETTNVGGSRGIHERLGTAARFDDRAATRA